MYSGPHTIKDGLVHAIDASSARSNMRILQSSNLLHDPNTWTAGNGGQTGYSANGSSTEQNRSIQSDDPWGRKTMIWQSVPDAASGADGGWNSSFYSIDTSYTYRWVQWVKRYTTGTGGTFYMGLNPAQIRNDNGSLQGNPYWNCPAISELTYDQWYCVVNHVMYEGYSGGRNPESGWYANGVRVNDVGFCNVGTEDMRWNPGTTSVNHRTYHYYTTNVNSGIEWCYPRIDKIDGTEPSLTELLNRGESGWLNIQDEESQTTTVGDVQGWTFPANDGANASYSFDGTDDYIDLPISENFQNNLTVETWYKGTKSARNHLWNFTGNNLNCNFNDGSYTLWLYWDGGGSNYLRFTSPQFCDSRIHHLVFVHEGSTNKVYLDGVKLTNGSAGGTQTFNTKDGSTFDLGNSPFFEGEIYSNRVYNISLSAEQVLLNYNAGKNRFT